jgi:hypothetical protein
VKNILITMLAMCSCVAVDVSCLSYKDLSESVYTDHVVPFNELFSLYTPKNIVELGLGNGTVHFIRNCKKVISIELIMSVTSVDWLRDCTACYKGFENWNVASIDIRNKLSLFNGHLASIQSYSTVSGGYDIASLIADSLNGKELPSVIYNPNKDKAYQREFEQLNNEILDISISSLGEDVEVIFIDSGFVPRADFVNAFFGRVPIIVIHDSNTEGRYSVFYFSYGHNRIIVPDDYVKIQWKGGVGTTFYIQKDYADLISGMQKSLLNLSNQSE